MIAGSKQQTESEAKLLEGGHLTQMCWTALRLSNKKRDFKHAESQLDDDSGGSTSLLVQYYRYSVFCTAFRSKYSIL
jgi:hypothetical protein